MLITDKMDKLLQPSSVEFILYSKMNPTMSMLGMFNKQDLHGDKHFAFATDRTSAEDDILSGILHEPVEMEEASQLPQIEISGIQEESGHTTKLGFEMQFTEEAVNDNNKVKKAAPKRVNKIGRNDLCPCGSGKKYKQCCGK